MQELQDLYSNECKDFFLEHFHFGDNEKTILYNKIKSKEVYEAIKKEFGMIVDELSDGLVIDLNKINNLGILLWVSRMYYKQFNLY